MTSRKRFAERYPQLWAAALAALGEASEPLEFSDAHRQPTAHGARITARFMPVRELVHGDPYEWVSAEADYDPAGVCTRVAVFVVRGDHHFDHTRAD